MKLLSTIPVLALTLMCGCAINKGNQSHLGMTEDADHNWVDNKGVRHTASGQALDSGPGTGTGHGSNGRLADTVQDPDVTGGGPNQR